MERAFQHLNTNLNYVDKLYGCVGHTSSLLNGVVLLQTLLAVALLGAVVVVLGGVAPPWAVGGSGPRLATTAALAVGVVLVGALFVYAFALEAFARRVHRKVTLVYESAGYREGSMTDPGCSPFRRVDVFNMLLPGAPRANGAGGGGDPLLDRLGASAGVFHAVALALLLPLGAQAAAAAALASLYSWAWWAWVPPVALILAALAHALGVIRSGLRRA